MSRDEEFARWYRQHHDRIRSLCTRILRDPATAEDIAQETLLRAWLGRDRMRDEDVGAWLTVVARNLAVSHLRRERRQVSTDAVPDVADESSDPAVHVARNETRRAVRRAMRQVGDRHRWLLIRHAFEGAEYEDLSEELGLSAGGTRAVLFRARQAVRERLVAAGEGVAAIVAGMRTRFDVATRKLRRTWSEPIASVGAQAGLNVMLALGVALSGYAGLATSAVAARPAAVVGRVPLAGEMRGRTSSSSAPSTTVVTWSRSGGDRGGLPVHAGISYNRHLDETGVDVQGRGPLETIYVSVTGERQEDPNDPRLTFFLLDLGDAQMCKRAGAVCAFFERHHG